MNNLDKTMEKLLAELMKLRQENEELKETISKSKESRWSEIDSNNNLITDCASIQAKADELLKKSEVEIRKNFAVINSIFESSRNVIVFSLDVNYCYIAFSRSHKETMNQIWGVDIGIGMNMISLISNDNDRIKAKNNFDQVLKGAHLRIEESYGDESLSRNTYENSYNPVINNEGRIIGISVFMVDITERTNGEKALKESEEKYRSLFAHLIDGSALHTLVYDDSGKPIDYTIDEINPAFETLVGISREAVVNKCSREAYGVAEPPYFEIYSRVVLTGIPEVFETYFPPLDKYFAISVYCPGKDRFATIFENITERKRAEEALRVTLTKYQVLFDVYPIGITITDPLGNIIESNKIAEILLGISQEELDRRRIDGKEWRIIRPDGSNMPAAEFASVQALKKGCQINNVEMGIVKEDDQITWINVSATPIPIEGYGVVIVYTDISARKQAEKESERTKELLEDSQRIGKIGGWEYNMDTNELIWTQEMYRIHEVDSAFQPNLDKRNQFYTPVAFLAIDEAVKNAMENGESYDLDSEIITAKGNRRTIKSIGMADFERRRIFGLFQDITDRKQAEDALKESEVKLRELNATKDKFFSVIAHDLKSPFSGIMGFSEMLKNEARHMDIDSIVAYSTLINTSANQTYKLVENLLEWARMQQQGIKFDPQLLSVSIIVKNELEGVKNLLDQKGITVIDEAGEEIMVRADKDMLGSLLRNLLSNAIKFTHKAGKIRIGALKKPDCVDIFIADSGVGMDSEQVERLFKIEYSSTSRGTENEKGTGLGLILCKEYAEIHGGTIQVESIPGEGSRFTISLPAQ